MNKLMQTIRRVLGGGAADTQPSTSRPGIGMYDRAEGTVADAPKGLAKNAKAKTSETTRSTSARKDLRSQSADSRPAGQNGSAQLGPADAPTKFAVPPPVEKTSDIVIAAAGVWKPAPGGFSVDVTYASPKARTELLEALKNAGFDGDAIHIEKKRQPTMLGGFDNTYVRLTGSGTLEKLTNICDKVKKTNFLAGSTNWEEQTKREEEISLMIAAHSNAREFLRVMEQGDGDEFKDGYASLKSNRLEIPTNTMIAIMANSIVSEETTGTKSCVISIAKIKPWISRDINTILESAGVEKRAENGTISFNMNDAISRVLTKSAEHTLMSFGESLIDLQDEITKDKDDPSKEIRKSPRSGYNLETQTPEQRAAIENSLAILNIRGIDRKDPTFLMITGEDVPELRKKSNPAVVGNSLSKGIVELPKVKATPPPLPARGTYKPHLDHGRAPAMPAPHNMKAAG